MTDNELHTIFQSLKRYSEKLSFTNGVYGRPENIQAIKDSTAITKIYRVMGDYIDTVRYNGKPWWTCGTLCRDTKQFFETTDLNEAYQEKARREIKAIEMKGLFFQVVEYTGQEC